MQPTMMCEIRQLDEDDIPELRRLQAVAADKHMRYVLESFPRYYEAVSILEPPAEYVSRQITLWGAFKSGVLVGSVGLLRVSGEQQTVPSESTMETFYEVFTEHDAAVINTLITDLEATYIGSPAGTVLINSLHVHREYRRQGIAKTLIEAVIDFVNEDIDQPVYIEISRDSPIQAMLQKVNFHVVKKTFSFSEWFQFSSWGSVLMVRAQNDA